MAWPNPKKQFSNHWQVIPTETMKAQIKELEQMVPLMAERDQKFAESLVAKYKHNELNAKGWEWVPKLIIAALERDPENELPEYLNLGDMSWLFQLFAEAKLKAGKKFPKIKIKLDDGSDLVVYPATAKSQFFGELQLTDGKDFETGIWYGHMEKNGKYHYSKDCEKNGKLDRIETALAVLTNLEEDSRKKEFWKLMV